eukprot:scpid110626/ scgid11612/ 
MGDEISRSQTLFYNPQACTGSTAPHFYGLPKIHKDNIPLRPIVVAIGSPVHRLAPFLAKFVWTLTGESPTHVTKSQEFISTITDTSIDVKVAELGEPSKKTRPYYITRPGVLEFSVREPTVEVV